jgi:hypothetical protein
MRCGRQRWSTSRSQSPRSCRRSEAGASGPGLRQHADRRIAAGERAERFVDPGAKLASGRRGDDRGAQRLELLLARGGIGGRMGEERGDLLVEAARLEVGVVVRERHAEARGDLDAERSELRGAPPHPRGDRRPARRPGLTGPWCAMGGGRAGVQYFELDRAHNS